MTLQTTEFGDRYRICSLDELRGERQSFQRSYETGGAAQVARALVQTAASRQAAFGLNHWRTVLYKALAAHAAFCNRGFEVIPAA